MSIRNHLTVPIERFPTEIVQSQIDKELKDLVSDQMSVDKMLNKKINWRILITLMLLNYLKECKADIPERFKDKKIS